MEVRLMSAKSKETKKETPLITKKSLPGLVLMAVVLLGLIVEFFVLPRI
jgi:hypothetical protein